MLSKILQTFLRCERDIHVPNAHLMCYLQELNSMAFPQVIDITKKGTVYTLTCIITVVIVLIMSCIIIIQMALVPERN